MPFIGGIAGAGVGAAVGAVTGLSDGAAGPAGGAGRLRIEPDQLDAAIQVFQNALDSVEQQVAQAVHSIRADPPAQDDVSTNAAMAFNRVGYENDNSAVVAWEGAVEQLRSIVAQLRAAKQTTVTADTSNSAFLRQ